MKVGMTSLGTPRVTKVRPLKARPLPIEKPPAKPHKKEDPTEEWITP